MNKIDGSTLQFCSFVSALTLESHTELLRQFQFRLFCSSSVCFPKYLEIIFCDVCFQKYLEVEDAKEEERKDLEGKVESLESIVRMFELKAKNAQDHSK